MGSTKKTDASGKKKWRIVIDFRKLNEISIGDSFPLPNINDILDQLGNAKLFSTLDLASSFHQIRLDPEDAPKTAFISGTDHFQFNRLPFGIKEAPAAFQRLINSVLAGLLGIKCFAYMDDIVIYGKNLEDHNNKLKDIFLAFRNANLKLQPDKCEFLKKV